MWVQLSFLAEDLGDIAPDHVDASLIGSHAIHAYLRGEDQDEAIALGILVQLDGRLVQLTIIGAPVLAAHHGTKIRLSSLPKSRAKIRKSSQSVNSTNSHAMVYFSCTSRM